MPRIVFISNSVYPVANSGGGNIVLYRHLKRFENEGYDIVYINSLLNSRHTCEFKEINIRKKWWFPPLRRKWPLLVELRVLTYTLIIKRKLNFQQGDIILSVLGDYTNLLALQLSKKYRLPLYMIYHDDSLFNDYGKLNILNETHLNQLLRHTHKIFAVSEEMMLLLEKHGATKVIHLYPIPDGTQDLNVSSKSEGIRLAFAGLLFEDLHFELVSLIAEEAFKLKGIFYLISSLNKPFSDKLKLTDGLKVIPPFDAQEKLRTFILKNANVLVVFYSFKTKLEHRMHTSFPSKFVEYCHYDLPILLIAPPESTLGKWAKRNNWKAYLDKFDGKELNQLLIKLNTEAFWEECRTQSKNAATTQFNPDHIHKILSDGISAR